jgi:predicted Zn-dependent protease
MAAPTSLCLIARNEEKALARCLASAADLFEDIVVVDTGSTDRTSEIAAEFGARVIPFAWTDDFAAARNESLRQARGQWVFYLDADETLDDSNREKLRRLLAGLGEENAGYVMLQRSPAANSSGPALRASRIGLFRNVPAHRWQFRVHEQIWPALQATGATIQRTDIVIAHAGYETAELQQQRMQRNLRLLELDRQDHPGQPFILLNLGWTLLALGQASRALPLLQEAEQRGDKAFALLPLVLTLHGRCLEQLGRPGEALAVWARARTRFPGDCHLLFEEARLRQRQGELGAAATCLRQLRAVQAAMPGGQEGFHVAPQVEGLAGYVAGHHLAQILLEQGRHGEAEAEWRAVLREQPDFAPARVELAELLLSQARWPELEELAAHLAAEDAAPLAAALFRARACLARQELSPARRILEEAIARFPDEVWPRVLLTHVHLQQGDEKAAEGLLREVLRRDPRQVESWCNLAKLLYNHGRAADTAAACAEGRKYFPEEPDLVRLEEWARRELRAAADRDP